ncbi:MAG: DUF3556 domain-containing protein [Polyangiales bacterium]
MALLNPVPPPYDIREWEEKPFPERVKMVCQAWALQGYGTPWPIYIVYILKIFLYIWVWSFFCSFTEGLGNLGNFSAWYFEPIAFQKAVLWSMAFEGLGLGCGSGPLTGRYKPPFGGALYFCRPGTTKVPFFPGLPILGGYTRTVLDVALYVAHMGFLFRALVAPELTVDLIAPTIVLLPLLGITDKAIFLASRAEHYYTALVCFMFVGDWLPASKWVWVGIWMWAATSKLNYHFPSVVAVMQSNSPLTGFGSIRKLLYRSFPDDLRPSPLAHFMAHAGTAVELTFPVVLILSDGGTTTRVALVVMLLFHTFITSSIPMGVPIEWNVIMVYGGFVLFGHYADVSAFSISSPLLIGFLAFALIGVPLFGNLVPSRASFLCSMRYYAGNWAYSVWLFKGDSSKKLDDHLSKWAPRLPKQLEGMLDEEQIIASISKVLGFRAMHLHGRCLQFLLPKAVDKIDEYEYLDGELVAGIVIGWNFGEGHLHNMQLLRAIQEQCHFEEGELRCIFVESQPMGRGTHAWTIADAATGVRETGKIRVRDLLELQPWPAEADASRYHRRTTPAAATPGSA